MTRTAAIVVSVALLALTAACSRKRAQELASTAGGASGMDASTSDGAVSDGAASNGVVSAARRDGGAKTDAGGKSSMSHGSAPDAGAGSDAAQATGCAVVTCPAPAVCDATASTPHCICPPGYTYLDVGGNSPPCAPVDPCPGCDGG